MTRKVWRLFVNTLTADDKYSLLSRDNSMKTIQMHLSEKQKTFSQFFCAFFKSTSNFEHFQKKMTLIVYVFLKLKTTKHVVRWMSKNSCLRIILFLVETIQCKQFRCISLKNQNIFLNFLCIFGIYIKFWTFSNKDDPHSLCISKITDPEKRG